MFRFFKLYSLYMNNSGFFEQPEFCDCEKLPRAVIDVPVSRHNVCVQCGLMRRLRTWSSDEEEMFDNERQKALRERRHAEEAAHTKKAARLKVSVKGKKPQTKPNSKRSSAANSVGLARTEGGGLKEAGDGPGEAMGQHHPKPHEMGEPEPSAPPPSSPSPPPAPLGSPREGMFPDFQIRSRSIYDNELKKKVKEFLPLKGPITDPSGGAISKRSDSIWGAASRHASRTQEPHLSMRAKEKLQGSGSSSSAKFKGKYTDSQLATQFQPFDEYDGPSEDALVVDDALSMLSRKSLFIDPRPDLPNNRIGSYGCNLGDIWMAPHTMSQAQPPGLGTNQSEEMEADAKESCKSSDTSSSPINELKKNAGEEAGKSEELPTGNSEYEEIRQGLGFLELFTKEGTNVYDLTNEDVLSSNKAMTEDYSQVFLRKLGVSKPKSKAYKQRVYPLHSGGSVCPRCKLRKIEKEIWGTWPGETKKIQAMTKIQKPVEGLPFTRKLKTFESVYHMCEDLPKLQMAFHIWQLVGKLSESNAFPLDLSKNLKNPGHVKGKSIRIETPIAHVATPRGAVRSMLQTKKKAEAVESGAIGKQISETKASPLRCNKCRHNVRNREESSHPRKRLEDSESPKKLEVSKLKSTSNKQRVCPVHSGASGNPICKHKMIGMETSEERLPLKTKNVATTVQPVSKIQKPVERSLLTRKLRSFERVYHMCVVTPKPQMVTFSRQLMGKLSDSNVEKQPSMSFFEFRVPDIELSDLVFSETKDKVGEPETPKTPKNLQAKNKASPVWPSMAPSGIYVHQKKSLIGTRLTYSSSSSYSSSSEEKHHRHRKTKKTIKRNPGTNQTLGNIREPVVTTKYTGFPAKNWLKVPTSTQDTSKCETGKEFNCPIYKCTASLKPLTFASHFERVHGKTRHQVVEGLPKLFNFNCEMMTNGNTFVALFSYSSIRDLKAQAPSVLRDHPLVLLAAPDIIKNGLPTGIFFWLVVYPTESKILTKLSVTDPLEGLGHTQIIQSRDISKSQNPQTFSPDTKDHFLFKLSSKKPSCVQICVVMEEDGRDFRVPNL